MAAFVHTLYAPLIYRALDRVSIASRAHLLLAERLFNPPLSAWAVPSAGTAHFFASPQVRGQLRTEISRDNQ
jgi:hypothetical protein